MKDARSRSYNAIYDLCIRRTATLALTVSTFEFASHHILPTPSELMRHLGTSTKLLIAVLACSSNFVVGWYGTVKFYADVEFKGATYPWGISKTQRCYNLSCWDNRASSVEWVGLPTSGNFNGKSRIAFFTGKDCTGDSRDWPTDGYINDKKGNYPKDFGLDGINDAISSFIIWENDKRISNGKDLPCPWGVS